MKHTPKMTRQQKRANNKEKSKQQMTGSGVHIYQNTTGGDLFLPKPAMGGYTRLAKGQKFQGDSYFDRLIGRGIRKIATVVPTVAPVFETPKEEIVNENVDHKEGEIMNQEKLILDQPERFTQEGQTEQVVNNKRKKLNENSPDEDKESASRLINEDPMSGVEIIVD